MKLRIPCTTINWKFLTLMRRRRYLWLALVFALIGGSFVASDILQKRNETKLVTAYFSATVLKSPVKLGENDIRTAKIEKEFLPGTAVTSINDLLHATLTRDMSENEIFVSDDIKKDLDPDSVTGKFSAITLAMTVSEQWMLGKFPTLGKNDEISIYTVQKNYKGNSIQLLAKRARVIEGTTSGNTSILISVSEEEAKNIMLARSLGLAMHCTIHGRS